MITITGPGRDGQDPLRGGGRPAGEHTLPRLRRPERPEHRSGSRAAPRRDVRRTRSRRPGVGGGRSARRAAAPRWCSTTSSRSPTRRRSSAQLAQRCPSVVWLVTSQTELGLAARSGSSACARSMPTIPTPTAAPGRSASATAAGGGGRAPRGPGASARSPLEEIAALIGGIPLALELAACQLQYLEPAVLLRSLQDPIEALVDPRRAIGRHRSMRACFELAGARLSRDATDLFAIISGRPGGHSVRRPAGVLESGHPALADGAPSWSRRASPARRRTARARPVSPSSRWSGRTAARCHARRTPTRWTAALDLAVFGRVQALFAGAQPSSIEPDLADIRRLLQRGLDQPEALDTAQQLAAALILYWWSVRITEGRRWLDDLLTRSAHQPSAMRPYAAQTAAFLDFYVGDGETARRRLESALGDGARRPVRPFPPAGPARDARRGRRGGRGGIGAGRAGGRARPSLR